MSENDPAREARTIEEVFAPIGGHKNGCTLAEYLAFAQHIREQAPCRLLVFGAGHDSRAWIETNHGGTTLILENNPEWIAKIGAEIDPDLIRQVTYQQPYEAWESAGFAASSVELPQLDPSPFDGTWDFAFVDAPWGPTYGRHQSTLAALRALRPGGLLALHDCERDREQAICQHLLEQGGFQLQSEIERLRIYRAP